MESNLRQFAVGKGTPGILKLKTFTNGMNNLQQKNIWFFFL